MKRGSMRLRPYFTAEWKALAGASLMTVLLTAADLAKPWPIAIVIDNLLSGHSAPFELSSSEIWLLAGVALLVLAISLVEAVGDYCSDLWLQSAGERIAHSLRVTVYGHLQRLSLRFHHARQKGELVTRVTGDVNSVGDLFSQSLGIIAQSSLLLVGMFAVTIAMDPVLGLVACLTIPPLFVVSLRYRRRIRETARRQRSQDGEIASRATEALSAMSVVKAYGSEDHEHGRVVGPSERRMAEGIQVSRLQARFDGLTAVLMAFGTAAVLVVGVFRVAAGHLSVGDLVVFTTYVRKVNSPLRQLAREVTNAMKAMARADRIGELLAVDDVLEERPHAYHGPRADGRVELEGVTFAYHAEDGELEAAVRDLTLRIAPGEHVAVIGPSGAGKSTLAALVARFYDPAAGRVLIDGRDARDCSLRWLREQVGVLLQDTVLFSGTVESNIAYGLDAAPDDVVAAARAAAADRFIESMPGGYQAELGPLGGGLSGGQRQRIGIARTLLRDPAIIVLDEPTTGLDVESEARVLDGLRPLMEGRTALIVTHSLELARTADRVIMVDDGRIVADGSPDELLGGGRRSLPGRRLPFDRALPGLARLLDPDAMRGVLERALHGEVAVDGVAVRRVSYRPGRRARVQYAAEVGGETRDAVAWIDADRDLAARLHARAFIDAAAAAAPRAPAQRPVAYDHDARALITWLPFDAALPVLALPGSALEALLAEQGIWVDAPGEPRLLGYRAGARAVIGFDGHVIRAYGRTKAFEAARAAARSAPEGVPAPPVVAELADLRAVVQPALAGERPTDPAAIAAAAGDLARRLHGAPAGALPASPPAEQLAAAHEAATLAVTLVPELAGRVDHLLAELEWQAPDPEGLVTAHGDFHAGALLARGETLYVLGFDGARRAAPAVDLATYAAGAAHGDGGDAEALAAVLDLLLEGYGHRPDALEWHLSAALLARATDPFRRLSTDWPARVEGMVQTAEEVLSR